VVTYLEGLAFYSSQKYPPIYSFRCLYGFPEALFIERKIEKTLQNS
jgi:hypothetical protein